MTFPLLFHLLTRFYLLTTQSASKLFVPLLTAILCKMTYKIGFTGVNTGIYTSMTENASSSDFLPNVHLYPSITLSMTNLYIATLEHYRDLGVIMSHNLSWSEHLKYISSRAYKFLGLIRRSFSGGHLPGSKKILYISLIRSQLTYCSQIWRPHLHNDITALERIQRHETKFILNDFSSDYKSRFFLVALQILPLMVQLELYDLMFFIRCHKRSR